MPTVTITHAHSDYGFTATDAEGQVLRLAASPEAGSQPAGIRPMQTLLMSLGGCSGIDVVSILKKQRQPLETLEIQITGEREENVVPALWKTVHLHFRIEGTVAAEKAYRAVQLSVETYCSVAETLRRAGCVITWEISFPEKRDAVPEPFPKN